MGFAIQPLIILIACNLTGYVELYACVSDVVMAAWQLEQRLGEATTAAHKDAQVKHGNVDDSRMVKHVDALLARVHDCSWFSIGSLPGTTVVGFPLGVYRESCIPGPGSSLAHRWRI